jgi:aryl-alcohol dehydrogenase-like predicted oxidoreductase
MQKDKQLFPKDPANAKTPWLWIGTWSMGGEGFGPHDERESLEVLHSAAENNVRYFDTAGFYAHGTSERLIETIIRQDREQFFISTKGGLVWNGRTAEHRASPEDLKRQLNESLERLKTGYLDLYQLHWPDPEVPVQESIDALKEFQKEGLIRFWGAGNLTARQLDDNLLNERNVPHQVHFNPAQQDRSVLEAGKERCINCIISPLEQGLLGRGKSSQGSAGIGKKDIRNRNPAFSIPEIQDWNRKLNRLTDTHDLSKVSAVLMWICSQADVHAIIPGPRKPEQLQEILHFKSAIHEHDLLSSREDNRILSEDRVKQFIPDEIWEHLKL